MLQNWSRKKNRTTRHLIYFSCSKRCKTCRTESRQRVCSVGVVNGRHKPEFLSLEKSSHRLVVSLSLARQPGPTTRLKFIVFGRCTHLVSLAMYIPETCSHYLATKTASIKQKETTEFPCDEICSFHKEVH